MSEHSPDNSVPSRTRILRLVFWAAVLTAGAWLTWSTRYFLNGDGINYIEMGEALTRGDWWGFINITASPGYALLLGIGQILLGTDRLNELPWLKLVNLACFLAAAASCELFARQVLHKASLDRSITSGRHNRLSDSVLLSMCYILFLFAALNWVRIRLVAPEMMCFALVLCCVSVIFRITDEPPSYRRFVVLGVLCGLSYWFKAFFLPFSGVFICLSGLAAGSVRRAVPGMALATAAMLVVSAPVIGSISAKLGRFSYGEAGNYNYALYIDSKGHPSHPPATLHADPEVLFYGNNPFPACTRPAGFEPCYWKDGVKPSFNATRQAALLIYHAGVIFESSPWIFLMVLGWAVYQAWMGALPLSALRPPSAELTMLLAGAAGTVLYSLVHIEMRYIAPFLFLLIYGLLFWARHDASGPRRFSWGLAAAIVLGAALMAQTVHTVVDQGRRALVSRGDRQAYQEVFHEWAALVEFLRANSATSGSSVAMLGLPMSYWARMGELKITAEIPDEERFLASSPELRKQALASIAAKGITAVVGKGPRLKNLQAEGWTEAPGAGDFRVILLHRQDYSRCQEY